MGVLQREEGRYSYRLCGEDRVAVVVVVMNGESEVNVSSSFATSKEWIWQAYKRRKAMQCTGEKDDDLLDLY